MLKKRKARGKPALETVSIFLALSIKSFLISSVLLPPPPAATPGVFWAAFAEPPGVFSVATALLPLALKSLLLLGVEVTVAAGVSLLSFTSPSCWGAGWGGGVVIIVFIDCMNCAKHSRNVTKASKDFYEEVTMETLEYVFNLAYTV